MAIEVPGEAAPTQPAETTSQDVRSPAIEPQPQPTRGPAIEKPDTEVQVQLAPQDVPTGNIPAQPVNARSQVEQSFDVRTADVMRTIDDQKKAAIQSSMASVANESPDMAAKAATIAAKLKLPVGVVSRNMAMFEKEVRSGATDYDAIVKRFPATGTFIENPDHAAVVSDDINALQKVEQVAKNGFSLKKTFDILGAGLAQVGRDLSKVPASLAQTALVLENQTTGRMMAANNQKVFADYVQPPTERVPDEWFDNPAARALDKHFENTAKEYPDLSADIVQSVIDEDYDTAKSAFISQILVNAPQTVALVASSLVGGEILGLGMAGLSSGANAQDEARKAGVSPEAQVTYGTVSGVAEAAFESLPLGYLEHMAESLSRQVGKQSAKRVMISVLETFAGSAATNTIEETGTSVVQDLAGYLTGVKKDLTFGQALHNAANSGIIGLGSGVTGTAPGTFISAGTKIAANQRQMIQEKQANATRETYLKMGEAATTTKLVDRQPQMNEKFLAEVTKQNGLEKVFIPVEAFETYFQSKGIDPAQMALALESGKTLDEAKETGAPLEIPYAKFLGSIGKSEHYAGLQNDVKFSNDALTVNEAKFEKETIARDVKAEDEKSKTEPDQIKQVEREIEKKLKEANLNPKAAAAFRGIAVLALREGKDPAKAIEELGLRINKVDGKLSDADFSDQEKAYFQREGLDYKNIGGNILDASSMFGKQAKEEAAPVEGPGGEVVALPKRSPRADSGEPEIPSETPTEVDTRPPLEKLKARYGDDKKAIKTIDKAQSPTNPSWVSTPVSSFNGMTIPNFESKPTGVIGEEGISQPFPKQKGAVPDQLGWIDRKYGATLGLIKEHAAEGKSLVINTSSDLVGGDEYIEAMPSDTQVNMFMLTKDPHLNQLIFPGNPSYKRQLAAVDALKEAGVRVKQIQPTVDSIIDTVGLEQAMRETNLSEPELREWLQKSIGLSLVGEKSYKQTGKKQSPLQKLEADGWSFSVSEDTDFDEDGEMTDPNGKYTVFAEKQGVSGQGEAHFIVKDGMLVADDTQGDNGVIVSDKLQRMGLATAMYEATERDLQMTIAPSSWQTEDGKAFWNQPNRPFGEGTRLELARKAGFDTSRVVYHGGPTEITEFKTNGKGANKFLEGVYMTPSKNEADRYRGMASRVPDGGEIYSFYPPKELLDLDNVEAVDEAIKKIGLEVPKYKSKFKYNPEQDSMMKMRLAVEKHLKEIGEKRGKNVDQKLKAMLQKAGYKGVETKNDQVISVFDPKDVRSTEAQFQNLESSNIFAQSDDADIKGQIRIGDTTINIDVFEGADMSTLLHEAGHLYLEIIGRMSTSENATEQTMGDAKTIAEWVGAESLQSLTVEQHEKFARGFEKYLAEGNAPTQGLKKAFARFKAWLVDVYKDLSRLNVELSPEIREVFDRIIASDAEIGKAEVESGYIPLFSTLRMAGLSDAQTKRLVTAQDEAAAEARELLTKKLLEIEKKKLTKEYREQQKAIQDDILKYLNGTQVYRAISLLQTGRYGDGTEPPAGTPSLKLDRKLVDPKKAAIIANKFGNKVFSNETGMGPDVIATALGFNDGADMIDTMVAVLPIDEEAGVRTADQMQALYPDLMEEPTELSAAAMEDVHNNSQSKLYKIELDILAENHKASLKDAIRAVAKRSPSTEEVRTQAETFVGEKSVKDLNPNFYVRAEQKANREAGELLANGDIAGAFEAKRRALLNYEMFKAATTAKQQIEKSLLKFKPIYKKDADLAKRRDMDLVNAARSILGGYELGKKTENPPREYLEKIKQYGGEDQYNGLMNLVLPALEGAGNWKDVSYNKFSEMSDAVNAIWELSRDVKQITVDGEKMEIEKATAELTAQVDSGKTFYATPEFTKDKEDWDKTKMKLLGARAALIRVEHWFRAIDGGKAGAFTKIMFQPVSEGTTKYRERKNVVLKDFRALMESIKDRVSFEPIVAKEIGHTFKDKTTLMMAMLHTGNESNKSKLLRGRGWGDVSEDGTLNTTRWDEFVTRMTKEGVLTKAEYDFFQGVWNLMESVKPEAQAAHRSIYGYHFAEITAQKIQTPFGEYQGGYVPAKVDIYESMDAEIRAEREAFDAVNNSSQFPTTGRGFSKSRVDAYAAPLSLDLTLLGGHIDGVLRFAHIEAPVKAAARLNLNKDLRAKVGEVDPTIVKNAITPWLQRAASQKVVEPSKTGDMIFFDNFAAFARTSAAMQTMFANVVNTLEQLTGVFVAASAVKPRHLRNATAQYTTNYKQMTKDMTERSQFMKNTQESSIYESQEAVKRIVVSQSWVNDVQDFAKKHTYFLQSATQNIVNTITWTAAYNQHVEDGMTEVEAVREADSAVRRTQGSNNPEDISAFETGTASKRLFTQFAGYFNMIANLNSSNLLEVSRSVGVKKGAGKLFYVTMMSVSIPAILSSILRKGWAGKFDEDDDDSYVDDLLSTAFWSQAQYVTAMVPWVGQLINAGVNKFNDNFYDDRMSLSPVVSLLESSAGAVKSAYDVVTGEEVTKRDVKDILTAIGFWSATPVGPIGKPVGYLMDVAEGEAEPTGAADFLRGLVSGRKGGSN